MPTLHHFAYNITPNSLELFLEMIEIFDCTIAYRQWEARWCQIEQKPIPVDIQIIETRDKIVPLDYKTNTHIAFLSDTPVEDIDKIEFWAKEKWIKIIRWWWSDKELRFDLPDIFVNFVIEVMHSSVVEV